MASASRKMDCEISVYSWYHRSFDCWDWMELLWVLLFMHVNICKYVDIFEELLCMEESWANPFQPARFFYSVEFFSHWDKFECWTYLRETSLLVKHMQPLAMNGLEYASSVWGGAEESSTQRLGTMLGHSLVTRASSKRAYSLFCWKNQELMLHTNSACR